MRRMKLVTLGGLLVAGILLIAVGVWLGQYRSVAPARKAVRQRLTSGPNVVLIIIDALRADRVGGKRNGQPLMTFLEEFSKGSAVFEHAVTACTWTRPSIASLLTSLHVNTHQVFSDGKTSLDGTNMADTLSPGLETMAEYLYEQGYQTAGVQTNGNLAPVFKYDQGFEKYLYLPDSTTREVTDATLGLLNNLTSPFFLYVHYLDPHLPYNPPEEYRRQFGWPPAISPEELKTVTTDFMAYVVNYMKCVSGAETGTYTPLSDAAKETACLLYDAEVRYVDDALRRLVPELQRRWPDTYIIISADHGEHLWDHDSYGHGLSMYEEVLHVPMIVSGPGISPCNIPRNVSLVDILPTVAAWLKLPVRPFWQGKDMFAPPPKEPRPFFSYTEGPNPGWKTKREMVLVGNDKLIVDRMKDMVELYDVAKDPQNLHDLSGERPEQVKAFRALLDEHQKENMRARQTVRTKAVMDAETEERLHGIGYK